MNVLLSGCSYMANGILSNLLRRYGHNVISQAFPAAGNHYISDSIIKTYDSSIDYVFVMFSGLWRLDYQVSAEIGNLIIGDYQYSRNIDNSKYIFSGGFLGSWRNTNLDPFIRNYFDNQYRSGDTEYLAKNSLINIINCINFLEQQKVQYNWGFIYDIYTDYSNQPSLGHVNRSNSILDKINWQRYISDTPYEYAKLHGLLSGDFFHLTNLGYDRYFKSILPKLQISTK